MPTAELTAMPTYSAMPASPVVGLALPALLRGKDFTWYGDTTDEIVSQAFNDGYDSVIFRNIRDYMNGSQNDVKSPFTVIVCQDPNQVKSTNNLVPTNDPDILYMLPDDADPREYSTSNRPLTAAQMTTFADSQLRDDLGRLKNMYVGRKSFGYEWFDPSKQSDKRSLFMTDSPLIASSYSGWPRSVSRLRDMVHSIDKDTDLKKLSQPMEEQADFMGVDTFGDTKFYEVRSPDDTKTGSRRRWVSHRPPLHRREARPCSGPRVPSRPDPLLHGPP